MNILFVCTGNTCRSPMAAGIFEKIINEKNLINVNILSAGICANNSSKATQNAIEACKEINIDLSKHISKSIFDVNLNDIDKFVVMTKNHKDFFLNLGVKNEKILILGDQILDPFGGDLKIYERCRDQIYNSLYELIKKFDFNDNKKND